MPYTTYFAFSQFRSEKVDIAKSNSDSAKRSRNWLQQQLIRVANNDLNLPRLTGSYKSFGSFSRKTKTCPLDDIDMLILLKHSGLTPHQVWGRTNQYRLHVQDTSAPNSFLKNSDGYINSTVVLNRFKSGLNSIAQYRNSEIKRNGVAVTLNLLTYDWVFDLVPAFPIEDYYGRVTHYLIPDGSGLWMATDPRKDQNLISAANQAQNGKLIPLIRLIKYWNLKSYAAPRLGSYYLETMLINGLRHHYPALWGVRKSVPLAFDALASQLYGSCSDPKGFDQPLDTNVPWETKRKVQEKGHGSK